MTSIGSLLGFSIVNIAEDFSPGNKCPANQLVTGITLEGILNFSNPIAVELNDSAKGSKIVFMF